MFLMTCNIIIDKFRPFKPNFFSWKRSVNDYFDNALIKLPAITTMKSANNTYEKVETGYQLKEGMNVRIMAGYDGRNVERFIGFIARIKHTVPLELECEGYAYLLRKVKDYSKSYRQTTVKEVLADLVNRVPDKQIILSDNIPVIPLSNIHFKNFTGIDLLDYLKKNCFLSIYFNGNVLYAGLLEAEVKKTVKFRLGWNVIKDNDLKFEANRENANVKIQVQIPTNTGQKRVVEHGAKEGNIKVIKPKHINDQATLEMIAKVQKERVVNAGYEGKITAFLEPYVEPGMAALIEDKKFINRTGKYFIQGVEGSFGANGGRQVISIDSFLGH